MSKDLVNRVVGDLEASFATTISKLPDLCLSPTYRLAYEDDFFHATQSLKLPPYRKYLYTPRTRPTPCPFVNPIPTSMLTKENVDNLNKIMVSSTNIEWKMLTSMRPADQYEENYYDKLIHLHRSQYKYRVQAGYYLKGRPVFKYTRHGLLIQYAHLLGHGERCSPVPLTVKLKSRFRARAERSRSITKVNSMKFPKVAIPTLTLTSDGQQASEPAKNLDNLDDSEGSTDGRGLDICEFAYDNFSRFSNSHNPAAEERQAQGTGGLDLRLSKSQCELGIMRGDDSLEDRVENIMSHLLETSLNG